MSIELVRAYLEPFGLADRVRELPVSSATVELAAAALGTEPARIAKTISLRLKDGCLLLLAAGDARIDNARFKAEFHTKAGYVKMQKKHNARGQNTREVLYSDGASYIIRVRCGVMPLCMVVSAPAQVMGCCSTP